MTSKTTELLLPMVVAWPLFLQNLDSTVLATALPSMAVSLDVPVLHLNLAITGYLLSLALCLPLSTWMANRFGAKQVFGLAIALFTLGSLCCGLVTSLPQLVLCRLLQGVGGAMMLPVGRLLLLLHVKPGDMIRAMLWFTIPGTLARMLGPLVGGVTVTLADWRWIFLLQLPLGLLGVLLAWRWVPKDPHHARAHADEPLDALGFFWMASGLVLWMGVLETNGKGLIPLWLGALLALLGLACFLLYRRHSFRVPHPLIDLRVFQDPAFRISTLGAIPLRIAIGASPFLLPLLMQIGFGLSPIQSGLLTAAGALGSLGSRGILSRVLRRFGFRSVLMATAAATSLCYVAYGQMQAEMPHAFMFVLMLTGGLFNGMAMVSLNSLGYSALPKHLASHATATGTMLQQLSVTLGVTLGASMLTWSNAWRGGHVTHLQAADFSPVFLAIGLITLTTLLSFRRLESRAGAHLVDED